MNRHFAFIAIAFATLAGTASAGTGLAGDITIETSPFVSSREPAQVRAELVGYKKSGVNPWAMSYNPLRQFMSLTTPAQLRADYITSRADVAALNGEDSGSRYFAQQAAAAHQAIRIAGDNEAGQ